MPTTVIAGDPVGVTDAASDDRVLAGIRISWPGGSACAPLAESLTDKEAVAIAGLAAGVHRLDVVVTDGAGNRSDVQTVTIEAVELSQPFAPVTVTAGDFAFAIEPLASPAPFTPRVIQVGSFVFAIHPLQTGGN